LPPLGTARVVLQERHFTFVDAFPKIICGSLHLVHLTLTNFPFIGFFLFWKKRNFPQVEKTQIPKLRFDLVSLIENCLGVFKALVGAPF